MVLVSVASAVSRDNLALADLTYWGIKSRQPGTFLPQCKYHELG